MERPRLPFDVDAYVEQVTGGRRCFICELVAAEEPTHEVVWRDDTHIVFLNRYPTLEGYVLVAPLEHRERVVEDFSLEEYLRLQSLLWRLGKAMSRIVATERLYILSLGSRQGNSHVHWHLAALPPGVPYRDQQFAALMADERGYLDIPPQERARLADNLRRALGRS